MVEYRRDVGSGARRRDKSRVLSLADASASTTSATMSGTIVFFRGPGGQLDAF
jgi:hypothetical protein